MLDSDQKFFGAAGLGGEFLDGGDVELEEGAREGGLNGRRSAG